jgi:hypothetical protein
MRPAGTKSSIMRQTVDLRSGPPSPWRSGDTSSVLVAIDDGARRRMRAVLAACRLTFVQNCGQLAGCLAAEPFDLVLIGSRFDAGRSAAALDAALRIRPACPVVCVATGAFPPREGPSCYTAFRSDCLQLGAYDTLDLTRWHDDAQGNAYLRALLQSALRTA